ncbi:putative cytoplasmic protein [hydrothermal vent metagenome]|uniref:Putative cytoplasmic protein n=1 Tax=hydrothermal vent metagenome TaxID=652676 RepID=A0A1W1CP71_9ZZZZ
MKFIILTLLLLCNIVMADELSDRYEITNEVKNLFLNSDFKKLTQMSRSYVENENRTSSGKWKLDLFYRGIGKSVKDTDFSTLEKIALEWIKMYPESEAAHISYAKILVKKGWYSRGTDSARYTSRDQWKNLKSYMKRARDYLNKHKKTLSHNPGWYALMLDIAKGENWDKKSFFVLLDEAIDRHPYYNPIYYQALYRMQPKWGSFSNEEIERVAQKALFATQKKAGNSLYARFYWVASQLIYKDNLFTSSDVNWSIMSKGIDDVLRVYPSRWNLNYFAYFSCMEGDKDKTKYLLSKINNNPTKYPWISREGYYDNCLKWVNNLEDNNDTKYVKEISVDELEKYISNRTMDKPAYIHFSTYKKGCVNCDIQMLGAIAKEYHKKVNFVSINIMNYSIGMKIELYRKYFMRREPYSMIVHKGKIIERRNNNLFFMGESISHYREERVEAVLESYLSEPKNADYFNQYKRMIIDKASYLNSEENIRINMSEYLKVNQGYKATAAAVSSHYDRWAFGRSMRKRTQAEAIKEALNNCKKNRKKFKIEEKCKLHMIGNIYVYEKTENEIKQIMSTIK